MSSMHAGLASTAIALLLGGCGVSGASDSGMDAWESAAATDAADDLGIDVVRPDVQCPPRTVDAGGDAAVRCEVPLTSCDPRLSITSQVPAAPPCARERHDVLIVLGSPANPDGTPSAENRLRIDLALRARAMGLGDRFITTGAAVSNEWVEANVLRDALIARGVPADAVLPEPRARHTDENLYYSTGIMRAQGWRSALVVSQFVHLFYAAECDMNCCVQFGRATMLDFGGAPALRLLRYELFPDAAPIDPGECAALEQRAQCVNLPRRYACMGRVDLPDGGL